MYYMVGDVYSMRRNDLKTEHDVGCDGKDALQEGLSIAKVQTKSPSPNFLLGQLIFGLAIKFASTHCFS